FVVFAVVVFVPVREQRIDVVYIRAHKVGFKVLEKVVGPFNVCPCVLWRLPDRFQFRHKTGLAVGKGGGVGRNVADLSARVGPNDETGGGRRVFHVLLENGDSVRSHGTRGHDSGSDVGRPALDQGRPAVDFFELRQGKAVELSIDWLGL